MAFYLGQKVATKVYFCEDQKFTSMPSEDTLSYLGLTKEDVVPIGIQGTICAVLSEKPLLYGVQISDTVYPLQTGEISPVFESTTNLEQLFK